MAITSVGYDGTVDEKQFRDIMGFSASSEYGVAEPGAFTASSVAGQVLQVRLTAGTAWTAGVVDKMDAAQTVQLQAVTSGSRWDMIVLRRDYQPPGGATTLQVVKGGASMTLPARQQNKGVLDEQPLWLVKVEARSGQSVIAQYVDLRVWARNGGATGNHDLVRSYLDGMGTEVEINGVTWLRRVGTNGQAEWVKPIESAIEARSTSSSKGNTVVSRNEFGNSAFQSVWLQGPQSNARDAATRKDYVDEMVDSLLDVMPKTVSGNVTITPKADLPTSVTVRFPNGLFSSTPNVVATADTSSPGGLVPGVGVDDVTKTGCKIWIRRVNTTPTKVYWIATN